MAQVGGPIKYGIKAGVNFPTYHFSEDRVSDTKSTTNFHVTGYADVPVSTNFFVQPGISLQGRGGKFTESKLGSYERNTMDIGVPVNLVGKFDITPGAKFFLGAGPYVAFNISGKDKVKDSKGNEITDLTRDLKFGKDKDMKTTDFGVNFLGGVELNNGFNIGAGYGLGLSDLTTDKNFSGVKMNNRVWSVSVGYSF